MSPKKFPTSTGSKYIYGIGFADSNVGVTGYYHNHCSYANVSSSTAIMNKVKQTSESDLGVGNMHFFEL